MFMHTNVKLDGEMVIALYFGIALLVIIFDIGVSDAYCIIISLINLDPLQLSLSLSHSPSLPLSYILTLSLCVIALRQ